MTDIDLEHLSFQILKIEPLFIQNIKKLNN